MLSFLNINDTTKGETCVYDMWEELQGRVTNIFTSPYSLTGIITICASRTNKNILPTMTHTHTHNTHTHIKHTWYLMNWIVTQRFEARCMFLHTSKFSVHQIDSCMTKSGNKGSYKISEKFNTAQYQTTQEYLETKLIIPPISEQENTIKHISW